MNEQKTKRLKLIRLINIIPSHENLTKIEKLRNIIFNLIFWWGVLSLIWCIFNLIVK